MCNNKRAKMLRETERKKETEEGEKIKETDSVINEKIEIPLIRLRLWLAARTRVT